MKETPLHSWSTFFGALFLLVGVYIALGVLVSILVLKTYPLGGFFPTSYLYNSSPGMQRESDCTYNKVYYADDGKTMRQPTTDEKKADDADTKRCLDGLQEVRQQRKVNDVSAAIFFLFVGAGLFSLRKLLR